MLLRLTFLKACRLDVFHEALRQKEVYDTRGKKSIETKDKRELILSQNNCVSERVFVVLIKSVTTLYIRL